MFQRRWIIGKTVADVTTIVGGSEPQTLIAILFTDGSQLHFAERGGMCVPSYTAPPRKADGKGELPN